MTTDNMSPQTAELAQQIIDTLRPHLSHTAELNGHHEREIVATSLEPANAIVGYAGYVSRCVTCDVSLSQQWN